MYDTQSAADDVVASAFELSALLRNPDRIPACPGWVALEDSPEEREQYVRNEEKEENVIEHQPGFGSERC